ncbi:MAG: DUF1206 domain-containing protein [Bauldia litoralis]
MARDDFSWAIPVMRAGYAGRGLVYLCVAGFSLYAIWYGGQASGTSSALSQLESTAWGSVVLFLIFLGMVAFAVWRGVNAVFDLEDRGTDGKGMVARAALIVSGFIHLGLAALAFTLLFTDGGEGGGSSLAGWLSAIMQWPGGRWLVALGGFVIVGVGIYYAYRAWREKYRHRLQANHFTEHWDWLLKAGLVAKGLVVVIVGMLFVYAAWRTDPNAAGGTGDAFAWLTGQPYGQVLVAAICLGLLGYALFCFVNAAFRDIPKVSGGAIETLETKLASTVRQAL